MYCEIQFVHQKETETINSSNFCHGKTWSSPKFYTCFKLQRCGASV